ncbi:hypothetical protein [Sphingomonas sp.]|uniref:hypothetical protein n=1 Tax=Sphingomonas sp. TaxID=28214 RepID=UPI0031D9FCDE
MRAVTFSLLAAMLALCSDADAWSRGDSISPDLAACELHVRSSLPADTGYRRIDVTREDTVPMTYAQFRQQAGASASVQGLGEAEELRDLADELAAKAGRLSLRRMVLTYQLDGEARPRQQVCAFRLSEGQLQDAKTLNANATSRTAEAIDFLADRGKWARQSRPEHSCCL